MEYYITGEDLFSADATNTKIKKDGFGKSCTCKHCGEVYDTFDHCMVKSIEHITT